MKVLVVDDSIVFRSGITQALSKEPGLNVFKAVSNGKIAVDFLQQHPDIELITLDMEMPIMNGLETIKEIRKFNRKVIIIVFSALTVRGAETTIDALTHGANDFVPKTEGTGDIDESINMIRNELMPKIRAFAAQKGEKLATRTAQQEKEESPASIFHEPFSPIISVDEALESINLVPKFICVGSSTGGPDALKTVFTSIKTVPKQPMFLVQHMPPIFTAKLAEALDAVTVMKVKEAEDNEQVQNGVCYIAPGDYHMTVIKHGQMLKIRLTQTEKVCFVRPSADVLFESVANNLDGPFLSIVLTGMGKDGTEGAKILNKKDNFLFIQDKESSAVWGMAGSIDKEKIGAKALLLSDIGELINKMSS